MNAYLAINQAMDNQRIIKNWLFFCAFMVFAMAVIGAITRLTESGLSITQWQLITGALPPLNEAAWQEAFALYRASPEFAQQHSWMELADYKKIFFWEWFHRLWGRLIGLAYALPLAYFWVRGMIPAGYKLKLIGLLLLGGGQGFMGWFMVQSGLVDRPDVSHYRLAAHLGLAFIIFAALLWTGLGLQNPGHKAKPDPLGIISLICLGITIFWGALVAGLDAGMIYNSFPLMNGHILPPEAMLSAAAPLEQQAYVQFTHRCLALITGCVILIYGALRKDALLIFAVLLQIALGISTLLSSVDISLATLHQAGAFILLSMLLINFWRRK